MITLKFPKLHSALGKITKDTDEDSPTRGVIVIQNNAIVFTESYCLVCDLKDYFMIDCGITDPDELIELESILFFMNFKVFTKEFWEELTKGANMEIHNGNLSLDNPRFSKDLHYKEIDLNLYKPLSRLASAGRYAAAPQVTISLPFIALSKIYSTMSEFKVDNIIFEFLAQDKPVKFTFKDKKHVYGFIMPDYDSANEVYMFETWDNLIKDEEFVDVLEEHRDKTPPPPPNSEDASEEEIDEDQEDLFNQEVEHEQVSSN